MIDLEKHITELRERKLAQLKEEERLKLERLPEMRALLLKVVKELEDNGIEIGTFDQDWVMFRCSKTGLVLNELGERT